MFRFAIVFALPCLISCAAVISSSDTGNENSRQARLITPVAGGGGGDGDDKMSSSSSSSNSWKTTAVKFVGDCVEREYAEMANCFGVKTIMALDRAARTNTINIVPGISFIADHEILQQRTARNLKTEEEIENSISTEPNEKGSKLIDLLFDSMSKFMESHTLQFRLPKSTSFELQRALDEGRGKIKKKILPFLGILAVKIFALLPLLLGAVGFLALKALIVGKIALVIAGILALQKYSHGGFAGFSKLTDAYGVSGSSYSPTVATGPGAYYRRSIEDQAASQHLAYNAHAPQEIPTSS